jgi:hypothetical protein
VAHERSGSFNSIRSLEPENGIRSSTRPRSPPGWNRGDDLFRKSEARPDSISDEASSQDLPGVLITPSEQLEQSIQAGNANSGARCLSSIITLIVRERQTRKHQHAAVRQLTIEEPSNWVGIDLLSARRE